ncbi:MAG: hypothetical protein HYR62_02855 [Actinobacteria bacterium]|nr:hypothetical protein [Actinomycetota bacterium]MBI3687412.1 hypothetical protein [Actinomycetota bacterium]
MTVIRKLLDLSTTHLPEDLGTHALGAAPGVVAHRTDHGWLMWVPDDPDESAVVMRDMPPGVVLAIQRYARALGCDYVLFDADGHRAGDLPVWDW